VHGVDVDVDVERARGDQGPRGVGRQAAGGRDLDGAGPRRPARRRAGPRRTAASAREHTGNPLADCRLEADPVRCGSTRRLALKDLHAAMVAAGRET
jgi:hypothetical protein